MNLSQVFLNTAARYPNDIAIYFYEEQYTFKDVAQKSIHLASWLSSEMGIKPGDRVGIYCKNRPEFITSMIAILIAGGVVVPINNFLKPVEVSYILKDCDVRVLISEKPLLENAFYIHQMVPMPRTILAEDFDQIPHLPEPVSFGHTLRMESDIAIITYTSGTTGKPKGTMLTHHNLLCNTESCRTALNIGHGTRFCLPLPMFHSFMLCLNQWTPLLYGGSIVLIRSIQPFRSLIAEICEKKPDILAAVPVLFRALLDDSVPNDLPIKLAISGSAPLPIDVLSGCAKKFSFPVLEGYGLSEASPVVTICPINGPEKRGSIGIPLPGVSVSIQDDDGHILPAGETGEICVRGENVMLGYWNLPEATAKTFRKGWLLTGDMGHSDEDGFIYITDRRKDMLLVNGNNVYPREIEDLICEYPGILEVAVVGHPDPIRGEKPVVFYVSKKDDNVDENKLKNYLKTKLANYKVPRVYYRLGALPRNDTNKILKSELRKFQLPK